MTLGEQDFKVFAARPSEQPTFERLGVETRDRVRATGIVRVLDAEGVARAIPDISLLAPQFQGFDRQPVLLARDVVAVR